jgi:hypothetical protein
MIFDWTNDLSTFWDRLEAFNAPEPVEILGYRSLNLVPREKRYHLKGHSG